MRACQFVSTEFLQIISLYITISLSSTIAQTKLIIAAVVGPEEGKGQFTVDTCVYNSQTLVSVDFQPKPRTVYCNGYVNLSPIMSLGPNYSVSFFTLPSFLSSRMESCHYKLEAAYIQSHLATIYEQPQVMVIYFFTAVADKPLTVNSNSLSKAQRHRHSEGNRQRHRLALNAIESEQGI